MQHVKQTEEPKRWQTQLQPSGRQTVEPQMRCPPLLYRIMLAWHQLPMLQLITYYYNE